MGCSSVLHLPRVPVCHMALPRDLLTLLPPEKSRCSSVFCQVPCDLLSPAFTDHVCQHSSLQRVTCAGDVPPRSAAGDSGHTETRAFTSTAAVGALGFSTGPDLPEESSSSVSLVYRRPAPMCVLSIAVRSTMTKSNWRRTESGSVLWLLVW